MVLSGNAVEHAVLMLACYTAGDSDRADLGRLFAAKPGSRQAQIHQRTADPGPGLCLRHRPVREGAGAYHGAGHCRAQRRQPSGRDLVRRSGEDHARCRGRQGCGLDRRRHHREIPVHLGLDQSAQGRDQHPWHAYRQSAAIGADLAVHGTRRHRAGGLAALEPHLRQQLHLQSRDAAGRHASYRRRQAAAGADRADRAESARDGAHHRFQRAGGIWRAVAVSRKATRRWRAISSRGCG